MAEKSLVLSHFQYFLANRGFWGVLFCFMRDFIFSEVSGKIGSNIFATE
jgi:hypothetical protein